MCGHVIVREHGSLGLVGAEQQLVEYVKVKGLLGRDELVVERTKVKFDVLAESGAVVVERCFGVAERLQYLVGLEQDVFDLEGLWSGRCDVGVVADYEVDGTGLAAAAVAANQDGLFALVFDHVPGGRCVLVDVSGPGGHVAYACVVVQVHYFWRVYFG
ncbi:hypothetical protein BpHYR1_051781 [Brachionus plicatilis]|uniref:Uncharacterized protein n=1 Tax=Brachionus plicatilis TaxID=10195 RepID=A0A3M7QAB9_BRAPC|nr:hypothetical protein BpHYR1_051781 [Brachionus plicatilis]